MKGWLLLSLFGLLIMTGCQEEPIDVNIRFNLVYGDDPLVMFTEYSFPDGRAIQFTQMSFYISDLYFSHDGEIAQVKDVDFIDLTNSHSSDEGAQEGFLYLSGPYSLGGLSEIGFNLGLTEGLNATKPTDYLSDHPLARSGEYWTGWESYIFVKIQGSIDLDNDGELETPLALHLGSDPVKRTIRLNNVNGSTDVRIMLDLKSFFTGDALYDIDANPQIHSLDQIEAAMELADNLSQSIYIGN